MDIMDRLHYARDRAARAEETEKQRLSEADTVELQQAASVRLATRQAVREALDDIIDGPGDAESGDSDPTGDDESAQDGGSGPSPEESYAGAGTPE